MLLRSYWITILKIWFLKIISCGLTEIYVYSLKINFITPWIIGNSSRIVCLNSLGMFKLSIILTREICFFLTTYTYGALKARNPIFCTYTLIGRRVWLKFAQSHLAPIPLKWWLTLLMYVYTNLMGSFSGMDSRATEMSTRLILKAVLLTFVSFTTIHS